MATPEEFTARLKATAESVVGQFQELKDAHAALRMEHAQTCDLLARVQEELRQMTEEKNGLVERSISLQARLDTVQNGRAGGGTSLSPPAGQPAVSSAPLPASPKFKLEPVPPPKKKVQGQPLAQWITAALTYATAADLACGYDPDQAKRVPLWDRDMKVLRRPFDQLGARELTRRWVIFCLDADEFVHRNSTFTYFAANTDRWRTPPKKTRPAEYGFHPIAEAMRQQARRMFEKLYTDTKEEQAHEDHGTGSGAGVVRDHGDGTDSGTQPGSQVGAGVPDGEVQQEAQHQVG